MIFKKMKKRFGALALNEGFVNVEQIIEALSIQLKENIETKKNRPIGEILVQLGYINTKELKELLEKQKIIDKKQISDPITGLYTFEFFKQQADKELNRSLRFKNDLSLTIIYFQNAKKMREILRPYKSQGE